MDNIIPNHPNSPDFEGVDMPTASEVADSILNNPQSEHDYTMWATEYQMATAFTELVAEFADADLDERDTRVKEFLTAVMVKWAKQGGFQ